MDLLFSILFIIVLQKIFGSDAHMFPGMYRRPMPPQGCGPGGRYPCSPSWPPPYRGNAMMAYPPAPSWNDPMDNNSDEIALADRSSVEMDQLPWNSCGLPADPLRPRIIGGRQADPADYPWIARLGYISQNLNNITYGCGGSLITRNFVLTVAHCLINLPNSMKMVRVRLGDAAEAANLERAQNIDIFQFFIHPQYNSPRLRHDIALIQFASVQITSYVSPICLPISDSTTPVNRTGQQAMVAGWETFLSGSRISGRSTNPTELQQVELTIEDMNECQQSLSQNAGVSVGTGQICASGSRNGENQDTCDGDSGGPMQRIERAGGPIQGETRTILIGMVSFGPRRCTTEKISAVYTDVAVYMSWLLSFIT